MSSNHTPFEIIDLASARETRVYHTVPRMYLFTKFRLIRTIDQRQGEIGDLLNCIG